MKKDFAVIFDMDGVIADNNYYHKIAIQQFCEQHGFHLSDDDFKQKIYGRTNHDWLTNLFGKISKEDIRKYADEKEKLYRDLYKPFIKPVKGLVNFLESLEKEKIVKAIATSAPTLNVEYTLALTGTSKFFSTILDERFVEKGKPDPEIYLKTAAALGFDPQNCIVIEDSLSGVTAAQRAGSKVIAITTTHSQEEFTDVDYVIHDFDELSIDILSNLGNKKTLLKK